MVLVVNVLDPLGRTCPLLLAAALPSSACVPLLLLYPAALLLTLTPLPPNPPTSPPNAVVADNEITGEVQWEDPGDVPFEDEMGMRYWLGPSGERLDDDPHMQKYVWVEQFSEDLKRPFFFNYETKETTWERPPDLAWRRIQLHDD